MMSLASHCSPAQTSPLLHAILSPPVRQSLVRRLSKPYTPLSAIAKNSFDLSPVTDSITPSLRILQIQQIFTSVLPYQPPKPSNQLGSKKNLEQILSEPSSKNEVQTQTDPESLAPKYTQALQTYVCHASAFLETKKIELAHAAAALIQEKKNSTLSILGNYLFLQNLFHKQHKIIAAEQAWLQECQSTLLEDRQYVHSEFNSLEMIQKLLKNDYDSLKEKYLHIQRQRIQLKQDRAAAEKERKQAAWAKRFHYTCAALNICMAGVFFYKYLRIRN